MGVNIVTFLKNIKYLFQYSLKQRERDNTYKTLLLSEEMIEYGEVQIEKNIPHILNIEDTIALLLKENKSFCRIGDGEINLIMGRSIPFQIYDKRLAEYLRKIIIENDENLLVGINYHYFHSTKELNDVNRQFYLMDISKYRNYLITNCNRNKTYIAAGFNQIYIFTKSYDYDNHFSQLKKMIEEKDIVLFCGEGVFSNIEYNIFDVAKSVEYIKYPSKNSFSEFDNIIEKCRSYPKEKILAFILGPTSKALVYELSKDGYTAWDIGHLAKDYDYYMKGMEKNASSVHSFFSAD